MALAFTAAGTTSVNHGQDSSITDLDPVSFCMWIKPPSTVDDGHIFSKGTQSLLGYFYAAGNIEFRRSRAGVNCVAVSGDAPLIGNAWNFIAGRLDSSGADADQEIFHGTLTSPPSEVSSYGNQTVGDSAIVTDSGADLYVMNDDTGGVDWRATEGDVALFMLFDGYLTVGQIMSQWYLPHQNGLARVFCHYGYNGAGIQPDWSGYLNNGTVTGATVANHVPLGYSPSPLVFDAGTPSILSLDSGMDNYDNWLAGVKIRG